MKTLVAILVLASACPLSGSNEIKDSLKKQYENQVMVPRTALQADNQEFDSSGKPLKDPPTNQWRAYGPLWITKVKAEPDRLLLEAVRVLSLKNAKPSKDMVLQQGKTITVEIHLDHPVSSADEAHAILDRVFFLELKHVPYSVPEFHRPDENLTPDQKIYYVGNGVAAPQPVYQPDPDYSDKARKAKYEGTLVLAVVIDSSGRVSRVKLVRALGRGLDEKAMDKVMTWRFRPSERNGQPVAVEVNVEVSFNLH